MAVAHKVIMSIVGVLGVLWWQKDPLIAQWQKFHSAPTSAPVATQTTVYTWKDKKGITYYSKTPDNDAAKKTIVDTSKISRLEPLPEKQKGEKVEPQKKEKLLLTEVREDMTQKRNQMQEAREKQLMQEIEK